MTYGRKFFNAVLFNLVPHLYNTENRFLGFFFLFFSVENNLNGKKQKFLLFKRVLHQLILLIINSMFRKLPQLK